MSARAFPMKIKFVAAPHGCGHRDFAAVCCPWGCWGQSRYARPPRGCASSLRLNVSAQLPRQRHNPRIVHERKLHPRYGSITPGVTPAIGIPWAYSVSYYEPDRSFSIGMSGVDPRGTREFSSNEIGALRGGVQRATCCVFSASRSLCRARCALRWASPETDTIRLPGAASGYPIASAPSCSPATSSATTAPSDWRSGR